MHTIQWPAIPKREFVVTVNDFSACNEKSTEGEEYCAPLPQVADDSLLHPLLASVNPDQDLCDDINACHAAGKKSCKSILYFNVNVFDIVNVLDILNAILSLT